jgi:hypothetical protein
VENFSPVGRFFLVFFQNWQKQVFFFLSFLFTKFWICVCVCVCVCVLFFIFLKKILIPNMKFHLVALNKYGCLNLLTFIFFFYSQIWLNALMDVCHLSYITKLGGKKKTKKQKKNKNKRHCLLVTYNSEHFMAFSTARFFKYLENLTIFSLHPNFNKMSLSLNVAGS